MSIARVQSPLMIEENTANYDAQTERAFPQSHTHTHTHLSPKQRIKDTDTLIEACEKSSSVFRREDGKNTVTVLKLK